MYRYLPTHHLSTAHNVLVFPLSIVIVIDPEVNVSIWY